MSRVSPIAIQDALIRAKHQAEMGGVEVKNIDSVAAVLAAFEILGVTFEDEADDTNLDLEIDKTARLPETFIEWAASHSIETHYERFLAASVYLYDQKQIRTVRSDDIMRMYEQARWKKPQNPADVFAKAAHKLYFTPADGEMTEEEGSMSWQLTRTGYNEFLKLKKETNN